MNDTNNVAEMTSATRFNSPFRSNNPQTQILGGLGSFETYAWRKNCLTGEVKITQPAIVRVGVSNLVTECLVERLYINLELSDAIAASRVKKAELKIVQNGSRLTSSHPLFTIHNVVEAIYESEGYTPAYEETPLDFAEARSVFAEDEDAIEYTFDITRAFDEAADMGYSILPLVIKATDETVEQNDYIDILGSQYVQFQGPTIYVTYETDYSVDVENKTHIMKIGSTGVAAVDLPNGNLVFDFLDFEWKGNRMPFTIRHLYTSALANEQFTYNANILLKTADYSNMCMGKGWRLNLMQSMIEDVFQYNEITYNGYVFVNEMGIETYFKQSTTTATDSAGNSYPLYEDMEREGHVYDPVTRILDFEGKKHVFDTAGRLIKKIDAYNNYQEFFYQNGRMMAVKDGAGRIFTFTYDGNGCLTKITAPDNTSTSYIYRDSRLISCTHSGISTMQITYDDRGYPSEITMKDLTGTSGRCTMSFAFAQGRVNSVCDLGESGSASAVSQLNAVNEYTYSRASHTTKIKTTEPCDTDLGEISDNVYYTVYTFDTEDNLVSKYSFREENNFGLIGDATGGDVAIRGNTQNLLADTSFNTLSYWTKNNEAVGLTTTIQHDMNPPFGDNCLCMKSTSIVAANNRVFQNAGTLTAGKYTLSAYVYVPNTLVGQPNAGAFLRITDLNGNSYAQSECITKKTVGFERLVVSFSLVEDTIILANIVLEGAGEVYVNGIQLEKNGYASDYNLLENASFEQGISNWKTNGDATLMDTTAEQSFNGEYSVKLSSDIGAIRHVYQNATVKKERSTRESFLLSGWAKGQGLPVHERDGQSLPTFRLVAKIIYKNSDGGDDADIFHADFVPCVKDWQYVSLQFSKTKNLPIENVQIFCDYSNNFGIAYFDDLQLIRTNIETELTEEDFSSTGKEVEDNVEDILATNARTSSPIFEELYDEYGNTLTQTTYQDGEFGTIYKSYSFSPASNTAQVDEGNNLIGETDSRGYNKTYLTAANTSRVTMKIDPCGLRTGYEYDNRGRNIKTLLVNQTTNPIAALEYAYDLYDNVRSVSRGDGMTYTFGYDQHHNLESISVSDGIIISSYGYKKGTDCLKSITYGNGVSVVYTYDGFGRVVEEHWFSGDGAWEDKVYQYEYDASGNVTRSLDIANAAEYNYLYENGRMMQAIQYNVVLDHGYCVLSKTRQAVISYTYNKERLIKKTITDTDGTILQTYFYEETSAGEIVVKCVMGNESIASHSKQDLFGRKVFDELQVGSGFVYRQFTYLPGEVTVVHAQNGKSKSSPTTRLVSGITLSNGRTITYEYDAEERITKVIDSVDGIREYTYDLQGQLLTEIHNGIVVNTMTYDGYGNILTKNGNAYTYATETWRDLLLAYNDAETEPDMQGNPLIYCGHALAWEKGRQLRSFDNITFTYNANGIRTSKVVGDVLHQYIVLGTNILRETWNENTLVPVYDGHDEVCGISYNGVPYYFLKNLQGDIVSIVNELGETVAMYSYDAWGVCTIVSDTTTIGIASINPYRYRGYYFDTETGLYYLRSRYYDPNVGRFLNADNVKYLGYTGTPISYNLFAYGDNDVVNKYDTNGTSWLGDLWNQAKSIADTAKQKVENAVEKVCDDIGEVATKVKEIASATTNQIVDRVMNTINIGATAVKGEIEKVVFNFVELQKNVKAKAGSFFADLWSNATKIVFNNDFVRKLVDFKNGEIHFLELVDLEVLTNAIKTKLQESVDVFIEGTKRTFKDIVVSISNAALEKLGNFGIKISFKNSIANLNINRENLTDCYDENGFVTNQSDCNGAKLGEERLSVCGCEVIAIYNAMLKLGWKIDLADVVFWAERLDVLMYSGFLGSNPYEIKRLLEYMEIPYIRYDKLEHMDCSIAEGNVYIFSAWNDPSRALGSLHTFMAYAAKENGNVVIKTYNPNGGPYFTFSQLEQADNRTFICGYLIGGII